MTLKAQDSHRRDGAALSNMDSFPDAQIRRTNGGKQASSHPQTQRMTVCLPAPLIERLRNAVYWTEQRTLARIITDALEDAVTELEHSNGGTFPPRLAPLKPGRPQRRPSPAAAPPEK
jgi:hypothetical protein